MRLEDYDKLKQHLEQAHQGFRGELCSLLRPFQMPKCRGFTNPPINLSEFHKLMGRLIQYENAPAYVQVCVRTAIEWLLTAYHRDPSLARELVGYSPAARILNDWTQHWQSYTNEVLGDHWKRLMRCFITRANEVVLAVLEYRNGWKILGRYCGGWTWFYHWADIYKLLVKKPQKEWLPLFWEQCLCRLAVKLGPKRKHKRRLDRLDWLWMEDLSPKQMMTTV